MNEVVLLIGGNIGDRFFYLEECRKHAQNQIGKIITASSIYETQAWGRVDQQDYLNQALLIKTSLSPWEVLLECENIEAKLDRKREIHWGERTIDMDIIFFNNLVLQSKKLEIPHPRYHLRNFVLKPLVQIIPNYICPEFGESMTEQLKNCRDTLVARELSEMELAIG